LRKSVPAVGGTKDADIEKILALKPTHVLTNREENTEALLNSLRDLAAQQGFKLVETFLDTPEDNFELIRQLGEIFSFREQATLWCNEQKKQLAALRAKMSDIRTFTFAYFIWMNPWMTAGNQTYISRCLELIGGKNVITTGDDLKERYPAVNPTDERIRSADCLMFSSEPFPFKNRHVETFQSEAGQKFKCMKVDGQALSWYGSRFTVTLSELELLRVQITQN
jgi:ABC-type Fe3+-hydroxamate transport system substrate-binding protein